MEVYSVVVETKGNKAGEKISADNPNTYFGRRRRTWREVAGRRNLPLLTEYITVNDVSR